MLMVVICIIAGDLSFARDKKLRKREKISIERRVPYTLCNGKREFPCRRFNDAFSFSLVLSHSFNKMSVCENPHYGDLHRPFAFDPSRPYSSLNVTSCSPNTCTMYILQIAKLPFLKRHFNF